MDKRKKQGGHGFQKDRYPLHGRNRGSDSLNWREEPTKPIPAPSVHHPPPPHSAHINPPSHHQHSFYHQAHQIDPEHQEIAKFLYDRWLEVEKSLEKNPDSSIHQNSKHNLDKQ